MAKRLYGRRWSKARAAHLAANPLCVMCRNEGAVTAATVVDHIVAHRGDECLFWDSGNWQSLCERHHNVTKQAMEKGGKLPRVVGPDGYPVRPRGEGGV